MTEKEIIIRFRHAYTVKIYKRKSHRRTLVLSIRQNSIIVINLRCDAKGNIVRVSTVCAKAFYHYGKTYLQKIYMLRFCHLACIRSFCLQSLVFWMQFGENMAFPCHAIHVKIFARFSLNPIFMRQENLDYSIRFDSSCDRGMA